MGQDRLVGTTRMVDQATGRELVSGCTLTVTDGHVQVDMRSLLDAANAETVASRDLAAVRYQRAVTDAMRRIERRQRPPRSCWRPRTRRRRPSLARCPECGGTGEAEVGERLVPCPVCGGMD